MPLTDLSDLELMQRYVRRGVDAESAFAQLVERHLNLVYSVALRQVRSSHLAQDVAQSVFIDLSRQAPRMNPNTPLVAWLHLVSRRTAVDTVRREIRRQAREQAAVESSLKSGVPSVDWSSIEPLLDEAVESLPPSDRTAILLRYFENKSLRDLGVVLGTSDDAAQKRVTRALDRLRDFFVRRGVPVSVAGLASDLSAYGLQTAPVGLSGSISAAVGLAGAAATGSVLGTTEFIAMTTFHKSALVAAFMVAGGAGLYQARVLADQSAGLAALRRNSERAQMVTNELRGSRTMLASTLADVERKIDARLNARVSFSPADASLASQMQEWLTQIDQLRHHLEQRPELNIPELKLLKDEHWFNVAAGVRLDSEAALRRATSTLRHRAENLFAPKLREALQAYIAANQGMLPENVSALATFLDSAIDPGILARYQLSARGKVGDLSPNERMRVLTVTSPADVELDAFWWIGVDGYGNTSAMSQNVHEASKEFAQRNPGQRATAEQLVPYLRWPVDTGQLQKFLDGVPPGSR